MSNNPEGKRSAKERFQHILRISIIAVLSIIALIFIFSNLDQTTLTFMSLVITMPGWLWFLTLVVIGVVIGSLFPWGKRKSSNS